MEGGAGVAVTVSIIILQFACLHKNNPGTHPLQNGVISGLKLNNRFIPLGFAQNRLCSWLLMPVKQIPAAFVFVNGFYFIIDVAAGISFLLVWLHAVLKIMDGMLLSPMSVSGSAIPY